MSCWIIYLKIPYTMLKDIPVLEYYYDPDTRHLSNHYTDSLSISEDGETVFGLYAWSKDKEHAKLFMESRNKKYFIMRKMDIEEETIEWESLNSKYETHEIEAYHYTDDNEKDYTLPMTVFEYDFIMDNEINLTDRLVKKYLDERDDKLNDDGFMLVLDALDPELLRALELLGWSELLAEYGFAACDVCQVGCSGDDPEYLIEKYHQGTSYGMGITGFKVAAKSLEPVASYIYSLGGLLNEW